MAKPIRPILQEGKSYTFFDYFKMDYNSNDESRYYYPKRGRIHGR